MLQGKICDRLRSGKQTDAGRKILMCQHKEELAAAVECGQGVRSLQTFVHLQGFVPHDGSEQSSR